MLNALIKLVIIPLALVETLEEYTSKCDLNAEELNVAPVTPDLSSHERLGLGRSHRLSLHTFRASLPSPFEIPFTRTHLQQAASFRGRK